TGPTLRSTLKICLHDGDEKAEYEGYPGNKFFSASNKARPRIVDRDNTILVQADGRPYAGCYVNAVIDIWAQDNKFGKRINASLGGVQFYQDGDAFAGGGIASEDDFGSLEDGADAGEFV
ncbi:ssDNA-binding protein, partial [Serratia symbiotica]|uniref:ssDNA-binding protein n=1 Tax=Serratia symbiotica TaxID=138074 RepID=UPI0012DDA8FA